MPAFYSKSRKGRSKRARKQKCKQVDAHQVKRVAWNTKLEEEIFFPLVPGERTAFYWAENTVEDYEEEQALREFLR